MLTATTYISDHKFRSLPTALRADLLKVLNRSQIVGQFASNVESHLKTLGEHDLARRLCK